MSNVRNHMFRSSNVVSLEHDIDTGWLEVVFRGDARYYFPNITPKIVDDFIAAPSAGRWFDQNLKNHPSHPHTREMPPEFVERRTAANLASTKIDLPERTTRRVALRFMWPDQWSITVDGKEIDAKLIRFEAKAGELPKLFLEVYADELVIDMPATLENIGALGDEPRDVKNEFDKGRAAPAEDDGIADPDPNTEH